MGPSANPIALALVLAAFFVGTGYLSYLFGKTDAHR
jgi:hypothetical protein